VHGDINRFFAGDPTAGILAGAFLFKIVRPARGRIAMWHSASPQNRVAVGGIMISAALTSFPHRNTEPIEFAFLVRRAGVVCGARGARGLDAVPGQHARHAHGLHFFAGWYRLPGFQRTRQIRAESGGWC